MLRVWQGQQVPSGFQVLCQLHDKTADSFYSSVLDFVSSRALPFLSLPTPTCRRVAIPCSPRDCFGTIVPRNDKWNLIAEPNDSISRFGWLTLYHPICGFFYRMRTKFWKNPEKPLELRTITLIVYRLNCWRQWVVVQFFSSKGYLT